MMGWGNEGQGMWGMVWFGGIFMILFWVVIIAGIVLAVKYLTSGQGRTLPVQESDPVKILKARYARGEIDTEEYEEKKKTLESE